MISQASVSVQSIVKLRAPEGNFESPLERVLVTRNRLQEGLGLALPAGKVALFGRRDGRRILIGEGNIDDHAIGERVEIPVGTANGVLAKQTDDDPDAYILTLTNDLPRPQIAEIELTLDAKGLNAKLVKRDGWMLWRVTVPANGTARLRYH